MKINIIRNQNSAIKPTTKERILLNRGIAAPFQFEQQINSSSVSDPELLQVCDKAYAKLQKAIQAGAAIGLIVDSDCDGFTSAAIMRNYLYYWKPEILSNIKIYMHEGKQHGLNDLADEIINDKMSLVICPDGGTNDIEVQNRFTQEQIDLIILDHHEFDTENIELERGTTIILSSQIEQYPNHALSGAGVVYQFCRYIDKQNGTNYAENLADLVACGNMGDMMDLKNPETIYLIWKGFSSSEKISNPFISGMVDKQNFSLSKSEYRSFKGIVSPIGAAFFVIPFINATVRSGTYDEKMLVFKSMLLDEAYKEIPSTKKGHAAGEMETLVTQAIRLTANIKNRQTKARDAAMAQMEEKIKTDNMLENSVLVFLNEHGSIDPNIGGLIANELMAKYNKPVCMLIDRGETYEGSARGCSSIGLKNFKEVCENFSNIIFAQGHANAFGLGIKKADVESFKSYLNEKVPNIGAEKIYDVDFDFFGIAPKTAEVIRDIAEMNDFWGTGIERPYIAIEHLKIKKGMPTVYRKNTITAKIDCGDFTIMMFNIDDDLATRFEYMNTNIDFTIIGECVLNEFNGTVTPQIKVIDYKRNVGAENIF